MQLRDCFFRTVISQSFSCAFFYSLKSGFVENWNVLYLGLQDLWDYAFKYQKHCLFSRKDYEFALCLICIAFSTHFCWYQTIAFHIGTKNRWIFTFHDLCHSIITAISHKIKLKCKQLIQYLPKISGDTYLLAPTLSTSRLCFPL